MSDQAIAAIARDLAKALMLRARTRSSEDQEKVAELMTALCAECNAEVLEGIEQNAERPV